MIKFLFASSTFFGGYLVFFNKLFLGFAIAKDFKWVITGPKAIVTSLIGFHITKQVENDIDAVSLDFVLFPIRINIGWLK